MAKNKEEIKGLAAIAQRMSDFHKEGTSMPAGKPDETVENQFTQMDMIAGICSAALFGSANRNKDNYESLLSNPNKTSYLGQIYTLLNILSKKTIPLISDKSIRVTLVGFGPNVEKLLSPLIGINSEGSSETSEALAKILININGIDNIDKLNESLIHLATITNDEGLLDGLSGLFASMKQVNELTNIDTSDVIESIKSIGALSSEFESIGNINVLNDDVIQNISSSCESISKIIESVNKIPTNIQNAEIFDDGTLSHIIIGLKETTELIASENIKSSKEVNDLFENINFNLLIDNFANAHFKNLDDAVKNIDVLHNFLSNEGKNGLMAIFEDLDRIIGVMRSTKSENSVEDISKILDAIFSLISFDAKINKEALNQIRSITKKDGILDKLFKDLKALDASGIDKEIKVLSTFIGSLKSISQIDTKELNKFIKLFKKLIDQIIILGQTNNEVSAGFELLQTSLDALKPVLEGYAELNLDGLKYLSDVMAEINKFILVTGLVFVAISYCTQIITLKTLTSYLFFTGVLMLEVIGFIALLSKIDSKELSNAIPMLQEMEKLILVSTIVFVAINLAGKYVKAKNILNYGLLMFILLQVTNRIISKLAQSSEKLDKAKESLQGLSIFVATTSGVLMLVAYIGQNYDIANILTFEGLLTTLIFSVGTVIRTMQTEDNKKMLSISNNFGLLILSLGASLALGSWIVQTVPISVIATFGVMLALLVAVVTLPLLALQIKGELALQGVGDLGKLILFATAGMLLGAWFIEDETRKKAVKEFIWTYLGFIGGIIIAVGLAAWVSGGKSFEAIDGLYKIIIWSTLSLFAGAAIFMYYPKIIAYTWLFGTTLIGFIGLISLAVGGAVRMMKDTEDAKWILLELMGIIVISGTMMILAGHFLKDVSKKLLVTFAGSVILLVGSIALIASLLVKNIDQDEAKRAVLLLGTISLTIGIIGIVMGKALKIMGEYQIDQYAILIFTFSALLLVGGIALIIKYVLKDLSVKELLKGSASILIIGLVIIGLGFAFRELYKVLQNAIAPEVMWSFVFQSLLLVGGLSLIIAIAGQLGFSEILKGAIAVSLAGLIILGLGYVFGLIADKLLKYEGVVGTLWAVTMSMLGITAVYLIAIAAIGVLALAAAPFIGIGLIAIALMGLVIWGLTYVFGEVVEADDQYGFSGGKNSKVYKAIGGIMDIVEYALQRVITMNTKTSLFDKKDADSFASKNPKIAAGIETLVGFLISIPKLMLIGMMAITLIFTTIALKGVAELMKEFDINTLLDNVNSVFDVIQVAVDRLLNLNTKKNIFEKSEGGGFLSKIKNVALGGLEVIITLFKLGADMIIISMTVAILYFTTLSLNSMAELLNKTNVDGLIEKIDIIFNVIEHAISRMINLNTTKKIFNKSEGGGFWDKMKNAAMGAIEVIGTILKMGADMFIIGLTLMALYVTTTALKSLNEIIPNKDAMTPLTEKIGLLFDIVQICVDRIISINTSVPEKEKSWFGKTMDAVGLGKVADIGNVLANTGVVGAALMAVEGIIGLVQKISEAFPEEGMLTAFKNKVDTLCGVIQSIVDTLVNLETSNKDTKYELPLVGDVTGIVKLADKFMGGDNENDITKNTNVVTATLATLHKMIEQIIDIDKIFPKTDTLTKIKTNTKSLCTTINDIMLQMAQLNAGTHKSINLGDTLLGKAAGKIAGHIKGEFTQHNTISRIINSLKSLNAIVEEIDKLSQHSDKINTRKIATSVNSMMQIINNLDTSKVDNNELLLKYISSIKTWLEVITNINDESLSTKTNVLVQSITRLFDIMASQHENEFADHVETIKKYVDSINAVDVSKVESMTNLAFAVTNLGDKIGNIDKFTDILANKVAETLIKLANEIGAAKSVILKADELQGKREKHIKDSIETITKLMEKEMVVKIENEQNDQNPEANNTPPGGAGDNTENQDVPNGSIGQEPEPTPTNTKEKTTTSKQKVNINYQELADAIADALKKVFK